MGKSPSPVLPGSHRTCPIDIEAEEASRPAKKRRTHDAAVAYLSKVPPDADLRYVINVVESRGLAIPKIAFDHSGDIQRAGYSTIVGRCVALGLDASTQVSVEVMTADGFEKVGHDHSWDRAVRKVFDDVLMDGFVRVRVQLS